MVHPFQVALEDRPFQEALVGHPCREVQEVQEELVDLPFQVDQEALEDHPYQAA